MLGSAVTAVAVSAALLLPSFVPTSVGQGRPAPAAMVEPSGPGRTDPLTDAIARIAAAVTASADRHDVPSNLTPPLAEAATDKPAVFVNGCVRSWREVGVPDCVAGAPTVRRRWRWSATPTPRCGNQDWNLLPNNSIGGW